MTEYVVMFPADHEEERTRRTPQERQEIFDKDFEFHRRLQSHGGSVTAGPPWCRAPRHAPWSARRAVA